MNNKHGEFAKPDFSGFSQRSKRSVLEKTTPDDFAKVAKLAEDTVKNDDPTVFIAPIEEVTIPAPIVEDAPKRVETQPLVTQQAAPAPVQAEQDAKAQKVAPVTKRSRGRPRKDTSDDVAGVDADIKKQAKAYNQIINFRMPDEHIAKIDELADRYKLKRGAVGNLMVTIVTMLDQLECDLQAVAENYTSFLKLRKVLGVNDDEALKERLKAILLSELDDTGGGNG
ncbi:hypothetical protein OIV19_18325 [Brucella sp. HL-2]|nr:hypothetical protein [Brucella sp. HL-2]MCV9909560.1 hypothetical protein [Brucella sp. HL-2]